MAAATQFAEKIIAAIHDTSRPPLIMGILNVTPDSFYDGGKYLTRQAAIEHGLEMVSQGADIVDVGGESTRPCAKPVPEDVQIERVVPVVEALAEHVAVSVDTRSAKVAEAALEAGAVMLNDVSGFRHDARMLEVLAKRKPLAVAMHMRGTPEDMMAHARYKHLLAEVTAELQETIDRALGVGLPPDKILVDPGIGFAKTWEQNLFILNHLGAFKALGYPILVGVSRKSFIGHVLGLQDPRLRLFGTAGAVAISVAKGARVLRVHDVAEMRDVVKVAYAICWLGSGETA